MPLIFKTRTSIAAAAGISVSVTAALSQYQRTCYIAQQIPAHRLEILNDYFAAWTIVLLSSLFASVALPLLSLLSTRRMGSVIAPCLMPIALLASILPIYFYTYWGIEPGWHIGIEAIKRYTPPVAGIVGLIVYGLTGLSGCWPSSRVARE
jgi:hypothetical protein